MTDDVHRTIDAVWRMESAKLVAALSRMVRDVALAEELAQDTLVVALEQWPTHGIPENPGAWLMTAAKRHAIDRIRHETIGRRKKEEIGREVDEVDDVASAIDAALDDDVRDDLLRLVFVACHPILSQEARVALTLRLLGGLTTEEIARAFLAPEPTIAQRIVRAKKTLTEARVPFEVPRAAELQERLSSVLEVLYLVFNEGYSATTGDDWMRPALCDEALRLGRVLAGLVPAEPEVHGLVSLMELHASRSAARLGPSGEPVLLPDQDRARWDRLAIGRGLSALDRCLALGGSGGFYAMQAAICACHARARTMAETDWTRIASLYDELARLTSSPVVMLNHAIAVSMASGPAAGLALVDALVSDAALKNYPLLFGARADLLAKLERWDEARVEFERAASLTRNARQRELLVARAQECKTKSPSVRATGA